MTGSPAPLVVNGWSIFAHPLFLDQLEALIAEVEKARTKDPKNYQRKNATKRLAAIAKLAFEVIPQDPARPEYRQGDALGKDHRHWFRAKFYQQYRLFFRFSASQHVIIYAWVNDEETLRAYESETDAYRIFKRMIDRGTPPDDWAKLQAEARAATQRLSAATDKLAGRQS
jgi:toxin YhaV